MAKKEPKVRFNGFIYPDGTVHMDPPEEFIERLRWAFQVEHDLELGIEPPQDPSAG